MTRGSTSGRRRVPPRWGALYALVAGPLGGLAALVAVPLPEAVRGALVYAFTLAAVAAMALWVRTNRVALARQDACACSWEKTIVRVIPSPVEARVEVAVPVARRQASRRGL